MKGLLLKDFYMARKYCRAYVVIAVVFSLLAVWGNTSFLLAYPVLLASVIPVIIIISVSVIAIEQLEFIR